MPCYYPLEGWRGQKSGPSGKFPIVFDASKALFGSVKVLLPCGQCIGCRLKRSRQWAARIMHEASLHDSNCFLTLTYAPEHLPSDGSLNKRHFQLFCKRLRKAMGPFRFFHCGEYGEQFSRPHYHACIFGLEFSDRRLFKEEGGFRYFVSDRLDELWGLGHCIIGDLTFESAAYVARYVVKKVTGDAAFDHYISVDSVGCYVPMAPEYATMSRRPGIAYDWFQKFGNEVFPSDEIIVRGHPQSPPRYYDTLLERSNSRVFESVRLARRRALKRHVSDLTPDRLRSREKIARAKLALKARPIG